jgi:polysaccharide pyruvyl transferase WcaK-like protein
MIQNYILSHAKALDKVIEKYGFSVVFLPHYVTGFALDDFEVSELIIRNMKKREKTRIINASSVDEFKHWISQMKIVVSSKMHPAVIAASVHVPFLFIAYDYKQIGFASSIGLEDCILSIRDLSYEKLFTKIEYVMRNLGLIEGLLRERVPELQKNVKDSIAFALAPFVNAKKNRGKGI